MAPLTRFERVTSPLGGVRSIQLSYRGGRINVVTSVGDKTDSNGP